MAAGSDAGEQAEIIITVASVLYNHLLTAFVKFSQNIPHKSAINTGSKSKNIIEN